METTTDVLISHDRIEHGDEKAPRVPKIKNGGAAATGPASFVVLHLHPSENTKSKN